MGDGIIAIFGFKDNNICDNTKSAQAALNSAIELDTIFEKIKSEWIKISQDNYT